MKIYKYIYIVLSVFLVVFSWGFIDPPLRMQIMNLFSLKSYLLGTLVFDYRVLAAVIYAFLVLSFFTVYIFLLQKNTTLDRPIKTYIPLIIVLSCILLFAYPAFSYDIFNYVTTAKVAFFHHENPYLVMPVEITNESYLAFTRAANKVALYGPTWLLVTWIPHTFGFGNLWLTIFNFKILNLISYGLCGFVIYRMTKSTWNTVFFLFNPLVIIETLVASHNDCFMMALILVGLLLYFKHGLEKILGIVLLIASVFVKNVSIFFLPLLFIKKMPKEKMFLWSFYILVAVVVFISPLREEMYPWYAIWFITFASLLPQKKYRFIHGVTIALSLGLELRLIPYILTLSYGGYGPVFRFIVSFLSPIGYVLYDYLRRRKALE